jgi:hypothetical protein
MTEKEKNISSISTPLRGGIKVEVMFSLIIFIALTRLI